MKAKEVNKRIEELSKYFFTEQGYLVKNCK